MARVVFSSVCSTWIHLTPNQNLLGVTTFVSEMLQTYPPAPQKRNYSLTMWEYSSFTEFRGRAMYLPLLFIEISTEYGNTVKEK